MAATAVLGVWQKECAGAFLYGLFLVGLDLAFSLWRIRRGERVRPERLLPFLGLSFGARILFFVAGMAVAVRLFAASGRLIVGLTLLLGIPLGAALAKKFFPVKEG
ncbi:MAG: hypothetical protein GX493_09735 [Firmicutes bacterium]|nr:hypothetical protein [Bacillota bacterium]